MTRRRLILIETATTALVVAIAWYYAKTSDSIAMSSFSEIWTQFKDTFLFERIGSDVLPSLRRMAIGFAVASVVGVLVGLALGYSKFLRLLTWPVISFVRAIPPIALIPPLIILIGIGDDMKIFLLTFVGIWPIALNTADGVIEIDQTLTDTTRAFRMSRWERLRWATMPSVAPRILAGMHISLTFAIVGVIATEYLAGTNGIGYLLNVAQQSFAISQMWAVVVLLGLLGYGFNVIFNAIRTRVLYWVPDTRDHITTVEEVPT